ncbi:spherulation-specific family 4 protein [Kitasatospora sp. NPDC056138]|uniref:spherulation-specific family 4 protein n=1 Tax=Kitasatospora sp. NPDC056138 TaxID=3345724 RepID=UPI0035E0FC93
MINSVGDAVRKHTKGLLALLFSSALTVTAGASSAIAATPAAAATAVRGLEIGVPAYVWPGDPMLAGLQSATPAASIVILNPGNGDTAFTPAWQAQADTLRAGTTAAGGHTRVIGYVHTDSGTRPLADVKASIDNYLKTADGKLHVDGIFFDVVSRDCGAGNSTRDYYYALRQYVQTTMNGIDPAAQDLVVDNPGTAIADCYLGSGHRTADTFVTYEGSYADYTGSGWLGGNVFNLTAGYYSGASFDPDGTSFWHLVHGVPDGPRMQTALDTAFARGAGYAYATGDTLPNPWDTAPSWGFSAETAHAATIG